MGAKVRNFYIFDTDEIDIEESALVFLYGKCGILLLPAVSFALLLFSQAG
jgi:hypothetical protein